VPSQDHEVLVSLFQSRPELAPILLGEALGVEVPRYTEARLESGDLTEVVPTEYHADLVVLLVDGKPVLGIIVEVQLSRRRRKRFTWPNYVTGLRARLECECCLLVVTVSEKVAAWASRPIRVGPNGDFTPLVVGPSGVAVVTEVERARKAPELAVLSAMAHGKGDVQTAVRIALCANRALSSLAEDSRALYWDLVENALGAAARKALAMLPANYQFSGPSYKKGKLEGRVEGERAGKRAGQVFGEANAVVTILQTRGIPITDEQRERILSCTSLRNRQDVGAQGRQRAGAAPRHQVALRRR